MILEIIKNTPACKTADYVYIHVGHNDSKNGPNEHTKSNIAELIDAASQTFPNAVIYISAVLPNRDNKNRQNIDAFNEHMKTACSASELLAIYINLTDVMKSPHSNLPRRDYYKDPIHPSTKAIHALTNQIKPLVIGPKDTDSLKNGDPKPTTPYPTTPHHPEPKPTAPSSPTSPKKEAPKGTPHTKPNTTPIQNKVLHTKTISAQGNIFQGHSAVVSSREDVKQALATLYSDPKLKKCHINHVLLSFS